MKLSRDKGFVVVKEYIDVVESAKTLNRPAFQEMITAIKDNKRGWDNVLFLDTSRLSRRRYHAQAFKHECKKKGVFIHYSKMPDVDPIAMVMLESMFEAMDEVHSLMSREKGLTGMAENVRQGFRAGGRAPYGYQLKKIGTGSFREGSEVTKTKLEPSEHATRVKSYLKARAAGVARTEAKNKSGIEKTQTTLIGMEWNALTYAGNTVWNVHNRKTDSGSYEGNTKRRPRADWIVNRSTHTALITEEEANSIINQLENSASKRQPRRDHFYLLSGMLETFDGQKYHGDGGKYYAAKIGKSKLRINKKEIESVVLKLFSQDIQSERFIDGVLESAKNQANQSKVDKTPLMRKRLAKISSKISKLIEMGLELEDRAPIMRKIAEHEDQRKSLIAEIEIEESNMKADSVLMKITRSDVKAMLSGVYELLSEQDPSEIRTLLESKVERVQADVATNRVKIHYAIGVKLASPRGGESNPIIYLISNTGLR